MNLARGRHEVVLFDLDGTLIDSAPDLGGAANDLRVRRGLDPLELERFRPMTGAGARGMVGLALGLVPGDAGFEEARDEFLGIYEARMTRDTRVFVSMEPVLERLERQGRPWGIVTNKAERFTFPLVDALGLARRASVVICGDTMPRAKPHPDPLLEAARRLEREPRSCVYVGDDLRDVQAGRAAGMVTIAAAWGYLGTGDHVDDWGADHVVETPHDLMGLLALNE